MTVVPAFCARFLWSRFADQDRAARKSGTQAGGDSVRPSLSSEIDAAALTASPFGRLMASAVRASLLVVVVAAVLVGSSLLLVPRIGSELFPDIDAGTFEIRLKTKPGTRLEVTEALVAEIEETIKDVIPVSETDTVISNIGLPGRQPRTRRR